MQNLIHHLSEQINIDNFIFLLGESVNSIDERISFMKLELSAENYRMFSMDNQIKDYRKDLTNDNELLKKFYALLIDEDEKYTQKIIDDENYIFDNISFTPAYIQRQSKIKVIDLTNALEIFKKELIVDIELILETGFPENPYENNLPIAINVALNVKKKLTEEERSTLALYLTVYEDVDNLKEMLLEEIQELLEPVKK